MKDCLLTTLQSTITKLKAYIVDSIFATPPVQQGLISQNSGW